MKVTLTLKLDRISLGHLLANGVVTPTQILDQNLLSELVAEAFEACLELAPKGPDQVLSYFRELLKTAEVEFHVPAPPVDVTVSGKARAKKKAVHHGI